MTEVLCDEIAREPAQNSRDMPDLFNTPMLPLAGRQIALTWSPEQGPQLTAQLEMAGAHVIALFASEAQQTSEEIAALDAALNQLADYDGIALTSLSIIDVLAQRLAALGKGWDAHARIYIAQLFPLAPRARQLFLQAPDQIPEADLADDIQASFGSVSGKRLLLLRAENTQISLASALRRRGAQVDEIAVYRTVARPVDASSLRHILIDAPADTLICTSPLLAQGLLSGVAALCENPAQALRTLRILALDAETAAELRRWRLSHVQLILPNAATGLLPLAEV